MAVLGRGTRTTSQAEVKPDRIPFLFSPADVRSVLTAHPALDAKLQPEKEGVEAEWFERVRKSPRQIYRVLGNTHYKHLAKLLEALDACLAQGYEQPRLLRTRARSTLGPDLGELRVAEHFLLGGCTIEGFDDTKGNERVTDLRATAPSGFRVAVEVYTPMAFEHLERFKDDLVAGLKNIDRPYDFSFHLEFRKLVEFDPDTMQLTYLLPDVLDAKLGENGYGVALVSSILDELADQLNDPGSSVELVRDEPDLNLRIELQLDNIELTPDRLPDRDGFIGGPNTQVPAPEYVFARIAEKAEDKAREGQALTVEADAAVLVVDLTYSDLPSELRHDGYRARFLEILKERSDEARHGQSAIAFIESAGWHEPFIPWFVNADDDAPDELRELLDPRKLLS
jgi:hypothetical protein